MFSAEAREKNISLSLEKGNGDFTVELDPQRTEQVIGNLIGNALRYIPEGSKIWLTLEKTAECISLSCKRQWSWCLRRRPAISL